MNTAGIGNLIPVFRLLIIEERNMLEEIGIGITVGNRTVRCVIIFRFNDLKLNVVLLKKNRLCLIQDHFMRICGSDHGEFFRCRSPALCGCCICGGRTAAGGKRKRKNCGCKSFEYISGFHFFFPFSIVYQSF